MSNLSPNGVAYNLRSSPFISVRNEIIFYFSSIKHKEKFDLNARIKEEWMNDSFFRRFHFKIESDIIADLQLYEKIEKRGFLIEYRGEFIECLQDVVLGGMQIKSPCSRKQLENTIHQLLE